MTVAGPDTNRVRDLIPDGFRIGSDPDVNSNTDEYYWTAFKAASGEILSFCRKISAPIKPVIPAVITYTMNLVR